VQLALKIPVEPNAIGDALLRVVIEQSVEGGDVRLRAVLSSADVFVVAGGCCRDRGQGQSVKDKRLISLNTSAGFLSVAQEAKSMRTNSVKVTVFFVTITGIDFPGTLI
jgi:hypothetical protein